MGGIIVSKPPFSTGHQIKQGCCDKKFPSDDYIAVIISNGRLLASCHIACWAIWHLLLIDVCAHASLLMIYHTRDHTLDHTIPCLLIKAIYMRTFLLAKPAFTDFLFAVYILPSLYLSPLQLWLGLAIPEVTTYNGFSKDCSGFPKVSQVDTCILANPSNVICPD